MCEHSPHRRLIGARDEGEAAVAGIYKEGFDENGQWEAPLGEMALERSGLIVDIGQVPTWMRRQLDKRAKAGELFKYRGYWNAPLGGFGLGPLKTIWARRDIAEAAGLTA
jgi:hypothetical protein